jgi:hypothetical protein
MKLANPRFNFRYGSDAAIGAAPTSPPLIRPSGTFSRREKGKKAPLPPGEGLGRGFGEAVMARIEASVPRPWIYSGQQWAQAGTQ